MNVHFPTPKVKQTKFEMYYCAPFTGLSFSIKRLNIDSGCMLVVCGVGLLSPSGLDHGMRQKHISSMQNSPLAAIVHFSQSEPENSLVFYVRDVHVDS